MVECVACGWVYKPRKPVTENTVCSGCHIKNPVFKDVTVDKEAIFEKCDQCGHKFRPSTKHEPICPKCFMRI